MTDILSAAKGSPLAFGALVALGAAIYAVEHLCGLNGPLTRLWTAWQERELRKLRREALILAERRRMQTEEEQGRVGDLMRQVADLRAVVHDLSTDLAAARARERRRETQLRALGDYVDRLLRAARTAGVPFADPPQPDDSGPIPVPALSPEAEPVAAT